MACSPAAIAADTVLRAGDQKGGTQSLMKAAGALNDLPYRLEWSELPLWTNLHQAILRFASV
jgi:sulfonate transport system substrate-binding protein